MRVYVAGYAPATDAAATGGFDWFPNPEPAIARACDDIREVGKLGHHSVTFVPLDVPDDVAYPDGATAYDRDGITDWIDSNLELVEVGLRSTADDSPRCIVYGCGKPADGEGMVEFALPGAGTEARVCPRHREYLAANTLRGVSLASAPGEPLSPAAREAVERLLDAPARTRPSAIVRRPDPGATVSDLTVAELLTEVIERATATREQEQGMGGTTGDAFRVARELSICITSAEDALTRHNKAVYLRRGVFAITDAERIPEA